MLKRIEIVGFKSFADKLALEIPPGLVGIVGPNGSGKSNIVDAFRWLLGERESGNLRGAKAEDLIFSGTPSRPRMGLAQASLVLDNSKKIWPLEFSEIVIKRQVSRDGTSEYFINKDAIRLKDLVDFFSRARLGTKGLSVVSQGESDLFIRSTPAERALMIEEALGLKEYRTKKNDSERRLAATDVNLERVKALIAEMEPRLRVLRRQTGKWSKREELLAELRDLENKFFGSEILKTSEALKTLNADIAKLDEKIESENAIIKKLEEDLSTIQSGEPRSREALKEIKARKEKLLAEHSALERELGRLDAKLDQAGAKIPLPSGEILLRVFKDVEGWLRNALREVDLENIKSIIKNSLRKIESLMVYGDSKESGDLAGVKKEHEKKMSVLKEDLKLCGKKEAEIEASLTSFNKTWRDAFEKSQKERLLMADLREKRGKLNLDAERWNYKTQEIARAVSEANRALSDIPVARNILESAPLADLERRIHRLRGELASIGEIDEVLLTEARETEERSLFLTKEAEDLDKASKDLRILIKDLEKKLRDEFRAALKNINAEFDRFFGMMFGGGKAKMVPIVSAAVSDEETDDKESSGIDIEVSLPKKKIKGLQSLSGGERSLVSIAALFALVSITPPPFLILDEVDAALDEKNAKRFAAILKDLSSKTQFIVATHNRATMEAAHVLYGITMDKDGVSKALSLKLESST